MIRDDARDAQHAKRSSTMGAESDDSKHCGGEDFGHTDESNFSAQWVHWTESKRARIS